MREKKKSKNDFKQIYVRHPLDCKGISTGIKGSVPAFYNWTTNGIV